MPEAWRLKVLHINSTFRYAQTAPADPANNLIFAASARGVPAVAVGKRGGSSNMRDRKKCGREPG